MTKIFDINQREWTFDAVPSAYLYNTQLPLPSRLAKNQPIPKPTHDAAYWADRTKQFDFTREDNICDPDKFNRGSSGKDCTVTGRIRLSAAELTCAGNVRCCSRRLIWLPISPCTGPKPTVQERPKPGTLLVLWQAPVWNPLDGRRNQTG
jgi:hypothetical protein